MNTSVKIAQRGIIVENLGVEMFLDHVILGSIALKDQRYLTHQMLQNLVAHAQLVIIVPQGPRIHWVAKLEHTMIALVKLFALLAVQGTTVPPTRQRVS